MKLNRRQLIGGAAVMAAMPGIPSAFAAVKEETRDLVIVGGGLGGLSAANAAVNKGCKALVIEKLPFLGGAGIMPEGSLGINTKYQKAHGIKTTAQQVLDAALQFHHFRADPAVLRVLIEESTRTIDEIIDMGVELRGIRTMYPKEESLMCWHLFKGGTAEVIRRWIENIKARGGELLTNTRVTKLIMTDGRVTGVEATTKSGDKLIIHAKKVIIATGGFAANKEMLAQYVFDSSALGMIEPIWLRSPVVDGRTGTASTWPASSAQALQACTPSQATPRTCPTRPRSTSSPVRTSSSRAAAPSPSPGSGSTTRAAASSTSPAAPSSSTSTTP